MKGKGEALLKVNFEGKSDRAVLGATIDSPLVAPAPRLDLVSLKHGGECFAGARHTMDKYIVDITFRHHS